MTAEIIARALGGHKAGATWMARCPAHDDETPSLSLRDGDDGKVLLHCFGSCDQRDVIAALMDRGLWPNHRECRDWLPPPIRPMSQKPDNAVRAREIWNEATDPRGTPVERYLAGRGLILPDGVEGRVIRYHPRCPFLTDRLPCMVARFSPIRRDLEPEAAPSAVLRTRLDRLAGDDRKLSLGPSAGQCVKLSNDEDVSIGLHLAEGIETGIALMMHGCMPIWVCATGTIQTFPVLDGMGCLTVFADHDAPGFAAAQACCDRWADAKREVFIRWSRKIGSDFADEVRR